MPWTSRGVPSGDELWVPWGGPGPAATPRPVPRHPPPTPATSSGRSGAGERLRLFIPGKPRRPVHPSRGWCVRGGGSSLSVCPSPRGDESNGVHPKHPLCPLPRGQPPSRCLPEQISVPFPSPEASRGVMGSARSRRMEPQRLREDRRDLRDPQARGGQSWCSRPRWIHRSGDVWGRLFFSRCTTVVPAGLFIFALNAKSHQDGYPLITIEGG